MEEKGPTFLEQKWNITYTHATGETAGKFLSELGNKKIMGRRCPMCKRVLVPPRTFCDRCYVSTKEWIEVKDEGVIEAFTLVYAPFKSYPDPPYALGYVRLNGADTAILNFIKEVDLSDPKAASEKLKIGTRVKVVFKDIPEGRVTDFWYILSQ